MKLIRFLPFAALLAVGCSPTLDTAYYTTHEAERFAKIAECRVSGTPFEDVPECIAAMMAEPYQSYEFWKANPTLKKERLADCKAFGPVLKGAASCQSVFKAVTAGMGSGTPVYAN